MAVVEDTPARVAEGPSEPDGSGRPGRWSVRSGWFLAALAALTVVLGIAIPFAPVNADDPVVSWPKAGEPATSTSIPLTPYRPMSISADVPCAALRGGGDALRTEPVSAGTPGRGLTVSSSGGRVTVTSDGATLLDEVLPLSACTYRFVADGTTTTLTRDGQVLTSLPALAPQVAELATEAPGTPGLAATIHPDDRYSSVPSALKLTLLILHAIALAATLVLAWRRWRGTPQPGARVRPTLADAAVVVVSLAWVVLSPVQNDDSWYLLMARNATPTGFIGNQNLHVRHDGEPVRRQPVPHGGLGPPREPVRHARVGPALDAGPAAAAGPAHLVPAARAARDGARVASRAAAWVPWTLLGAHLAWFLPYGMALRPEVFIVPLFAAVMLLCEVARRREAVGPLIPATAAAALAVTVSPGGLVAAAPVVVLLPWLYRWLTTASWRTRLGVVGAVIAAGTIAIPIAFGDATLGDVLEATDVHSWYYVTFPWYEEWAHYRTLIETGTWGRRVPVLLTVVLLVVVSIGSGRRGPIGGPIREYTLVDGGDDGGRARPARARPDEVGQPLRRDRRARDGAADARDAADAAAAPTGRARHRGERRAADGRDGARASPGRTPGTPTPTGASRSASTSTPTCRCSTWRASPRTSARSTCASSGGGSVSPCWPGCSSGGGVGSTAAPSA